MNKHLLAGAMGVLVWTGAAAQTTPATQTPATQTPAAQTAPAKPAASAATTPDNLRQQMVSDMQKAGFTDVRVRPDSFLVQAKGKDGTPVTMLIDPNSITEIVGSGGAATAQGSTPAAGTFATVPSTDALESKVVGTSVRNNASQDIGTIKDVAYSATGVKAYIVSVGGFLGVGDHYVAVNPSALNLSYDANSKTWQATMNATADQLKAAPEFKYAG